MVEALSTAFAQVRVGDPFEPYTAMGPLVAERQRGRVEGYIAKGLEEGAVLAAGGGRPKHLERGWYIEPTVFANVDNRHTIAQERDLRARPQRDPGRQRGPSRRYRE
jgi:acyl-CoA reductase-like NAD-dependent aldehyde dehydrogenase